MTYLGQTPAVLAIRAYRRWVSGRGPLRRVCCTFASTESCSAYGLRATAELATSLPHAMWLVRARLRACRRTSIYRFDTGLGWERDHEHAPAELARLLAQRGERPDTIAQILAARTLVARWRGERDAYAAATRPIVIANISASSRGEGDVSAATTHVAAHRIPNIQVSASSRDASAATTPIAARHRIPVRAGDAAIARYRRAVRRGLALIVLAIAAGVLLSGWFALLVVVGIAVMTNARAAARRLEQQRVAAKFLRPAIS